MHLKPVASLLLSSLLCQSTSANPISQSNAARNAVPDAATNHLNTRQLNKAQQSNIQEATEYFNSKTASRNVVKTTTTQNGQVIDWIPIGSQGKIASPPPLPVAPAPAMSGASKPQSELQLDGADKGPEGTVPILRQNLALLNPNQTLQERMSKSGPPMKEPGLQKRQAQPHWYASTAQVVANTGGTGTFSLFDAYVQSSSDFSLLQTAVIRTGVPVAGNPSQTTMQTLEGGWINYPAQVAQPHLFTYYTTDDYSSEGDNVGGWNTEVAGWVQTDDTYFPGTTFSPLSIDGGDQYEMELQYTLYEGNWWLYVIDKYIGYYPASLYSNASSDASQSLATQSNQINFYGEIYQSESALTTTDMGSGEFPSTGFGKSGYIHSIQYTDTSGNAQNYDGSQQVIVSDSSRYNLAQNFNSGTSFGSYFYLGGPGAGGVVGG